MAKIDRVADLPEWFALAKYQGCEAFGVADWYRHLLERRSLFIACLDLKDVALANDSSCDWYQESVEQLRESPLMLSPSLSDIEVKHQPVRPLRAYDLFITEAERAHQLSLQEPSDSPWLHSGSSEPEIMVLSAGSSSLQPTLLVDLGADDATLKAAFAFWLAGARRQYPELKSSRSKPNWQRWARYGLLPYLDLMIWSIETKTHIPDRVMSAAISSYDAGEANLRKTISPLAESLMHDLSGIQSLAALSAAVMTPANSETFDS